MGEKSLYLGIQAMLFHGSQQNNSTSFLTGTFLGEKWIVCVCGLLISTACLFIAIYYATLFYSDVFVDEMKMTTTVGFNS